MKISVKRVYAEPARADGLRILVDRLWPRGLSKSAAKIDHWARELSPSNELRKWYAHEARKWPEFKRGFFSELRTKAAPLAKLRLLATKQKVTLLFGSKEPRLNNAYALKDALESPARQHKRAGKLPRRPRR